MRDEGRGTRAGTRRRRVGGRRRVNSRRVSLVAIAAMPCIALCLPTGSASAQGVVPECQPGAGSPETRDACQKAVDLFNYMAPQLGAIISGGNATLGQGGTLRGLGHVAVAVRATTLLGAIPRVDLVPPATTGPVSSSYETARQFIGLPALDAAIGVLPGLPLGLTTVGGVDPLRAHHARRHDA